jgi:hypothetical protein
MKHTISSTVTLREYELFHPLILLFLDFKALVILKEINKRYYKTIDDECRTIGYWPALCNAYCYFAGLYSPIIYDPELIYSINYRKHFFDDLWPLRNKWSLENAATTTTTANSQQSYKIKVACRFRPGETPEGKVCLPLHQFLKLKRQQKLQNNNENENDNLILVGEKEPEEFLDPFLGTLMKDPVLLRSSNRVCDRSVALQCILRGGRDPFNNRKLTQPMLEPLPELLQRIQEWREKNFQAKRDVSVDLKDTKYLVDNNQGFSPELLEALLEMQRINRTLKKAKQDMNNNNHNNNAEDSLTHPEVHENIFEEVQEDLNNNNNNNNNNLFGNQENLFMNFNNLLAPHQQQQQQQQQLLPGQGKKAEVARVVEVNNNQSFISMHIPGSGVRPFHYSYVYDTKMKQTDIYESSVKESVSSVLNGCNASIMCYGQTGSGKTYTFLGPEGCLEDLSELLDDRNSRRRELSFMKYPNLGLVLRTVQDLFQAKKSLSHYNIQMTIGIQFIEVYEEKTTDLITRRPVTVRRENGHVNGPIIHCDDMLDALQYIQTAHQNQHYAETAMNARSSRAHTIFIFHISQQWSLPKERRTNASSSSTAEEQILLQSQLHLVDLAGSERVKKSHVTGLHFREAVGINSSLLVLGKVISSLVEEKSHVPYYESKLTTILKSSFGGNSRTMVVINTRMEDLYGDETLQTLRFGERCSMISNNLKQSATSFEDTLFLLQQALQNLLKSMKVFEEKGKCHLSSYQNLVLSYDNLERKKNELIFLQQEKEKQGTPHRSHQLVESY